MSDVLDSNQIPDAFDDCRSYSNCVVDDDQDNAESNSAATTQSEPEWMHCHHQPTADLTDALTILALVLAVCLIFHTFIRVMEFFTNE